MAISIIHLELPSIIFKYAAAFSITAYIFMFLGYEFFSNSLESAK